MRKDPKHVQAGAAPIAGNDAAQRLSDHAPADPATSAKRKPNGSKSSAPKADADHPPKRKQRTKSDAADTKKQKTAKRAASPVPHNQSIGAAMNRGSAAKVARKR